MIASLRETFPGIDWEKQATYFFQRAIEHGRRRAEEMREAAVTVREAGPRALERGRHRRAPGLDGRSRRRGRVRRADTAGVRAHARTGASRPTGSSTHLKTERRTERCRRSRRRPAGSTGAPRPSKPRFTPPPGAVDAHCHVFGPGAEFPYAPERKYTPCDASKAQLFALRDHLGFARNVIVQATCHGADNRAMVDALPRAAAGRRAAWPPSAATSPTPSCASCTTPACAACASISSSAWSTSRRATSWRRSPRASQPLGWHVVVYFEARDLPELWDFFTALPTTVVVDHMGRPDVTKPIDGPEFGLFLDLMRRAREHLDQGQLPRAPLGQRVRRR